MKLFELFRPRHDANRTGARNDGQPTEPLEAKRSVFSEVIAQYCREYEEQFEAALRDVERLEVQNSELRVALNVQLEKVEILESELHSEPQKELGEESEMGDAPQYSTRELLEKIDAKANQGDTEALAIAGLCHLFAIGRRRNSILGEQWLTQIASSSFPDAALVLGLLKEHGVILEKGSEQALHWFKVASSAYARELKQTIYDLEEDIASARYQRRRSRLEQSKEQAAKARNTAKADLLRREIEAAKLRHNRAYAVLPEDDYDVIERKAARLARKIGLECIRKAKRFNRLMPRFSTEFVNQDVRVLARRFAMRQGFLQHAIAEGMEALKIPEDEITTELREIFIKALRNTISEAPIKSSKSRFTPKG